MNGEVTQRLKLIRRYDAAVRSLKIYRFVRLPSTLCSELANGCTRLRPHREPDPHFPRNPKRRRHPLRNRRSSLRRALRNLLRRTQLHSLPCKQRSRHRRMWSLQLCIRRAWRALKASCRLRGASSCPTCPLCRRFSNATRSRTLLQQTSLPERLASRSSRSRSLHSSAQPLASSLCRQSNALCVDFAQDL